MATSKVQGTTNSTQVSDLQKERQYYQAQPLSDLGTANAGIQQVVSEAQADAVAEEEQLQPILSALDVQGSPLPTTVVNVNAGAASANPNPNIGQKTNASGTSPSTATGITAGSPIANANQNTVHVCDICGPLGYGIASARSAILQALKSARDAILNALGLGDAEAQVKAAQQAINMAKKVINAIKSAIDFIQTWMKKLEALIQALEQGLTEMIKNGLHAIAAQFQQCLTDAKASYAQGQASFNAQQQAQAQASATNATSSASTAG
jgi:hypothetical protein